MACRTRLFLSLVVLTSCGPGFAGERGDPKPSAAWEAGQITRLEGLTVSLSKPALVARSKGYLWFPTLVPLAGGDLLAIMSNFADELRNSPTSDMAWSSDGGHTWTAPISAPYSESYLQLASGDALLLPCYLRPGDQGAMVGPSVVCRKGEQRVTVKPDAISVAGWPKPDRSLDPKLGLSGFVFNGQTVVLKDGMYLATLYGYFKDAQRYSLVAAESPDGMRWKFRSTIAGDDCLLPGREGPCESAICRLRDGRLMSVFRTEPLLPYGQTWSSDDGRTWSEPVAMKEVFSVQPSLVVLPDGVVALSGGRNGLYLWINLDGTGNTWQRVDVWANHNAALAGEPFKRGDNTSSYTEVVVRDEGHLLYIYDRIPNNWSPIPADSEETNSVWVVQATLERTAK